MAELPESGSPASMEDRLEALLDDSATPAPEGPAEEDAVGDEVTDDEQEPQADSGVVEEEVDGVTVRGTKDAVERLKSERAHKQDYTRRTQEAAEMRRAAEDRLQFAEAREQVMAEVMQDVAQLQEKRSRLTQLSALDLGQLYNADPAQMFSVQRQIDSLKSEIAEAERGINGKAQRAQAMFEQHRSRQWEMAEKGARQAIGHVSDAENNAMLQQVVKLGFEEAELKGRFADARFLQAIYKAAKYDMLQAGKPQALQTASKAPPVVKPGTAGPNQFSQRMQFGKAMKAARSDTAKADLIGARLMNRFKI